MSDSTTLSAPAVAVGSLSLAAIPAGRRDTAMQIARAFATAGYGLLHQATAIANAMRESSLDPHQITQTGHERSLGLFQLNTQGGLGAGHTDAELLDPAHNIQIILTEVGHHPEFRQAATLADAVAAFVHKVERPAEPEMEIATRLKIAHTLLA